MSRFINSGEDIIEVLSVFDLCGTGKITGLTPSSFTSFLVLKNGAKYDYPIDVEEVIVDGTPTGNYRFKLNVAGVLGDEFYWTVFSEYDMAWHYYDYYMANLHIDLSDALAQLTFRRTDIEADVIPDMYVMAEVVDAPSVDAWVVVDTVVDAVSQADKTVEAEVLDSGVDAGID